MLGSADEGDAARRPQDTIASVATAIAAAETRTRER
jgi:hypothetical protein